MIVIMNLIICLILSLELPLKYVSIFSFASLLLVKRGHSLDDVNNLKIAKHITYFWKEKHKRFDHLNEIIKVVSTSYTLDTDIFIHTNRLFPIDILEMNSKGKLEIIVHEFESNWYEQLNNSISDAVRRTLKNPFPMNKDLYLSWKCRYLIKAQSHLYDIFMYLEDDIIVPDKAIMNYWLKYKYLCLSNGYNVGFIRIEEFNGNRHCIDINYPFSHQNKISLGEEEFIINNRNMYCAFWIYDRNELLKWIASEYYDPVTIIGYDVRERSGIGLHGKNTPWYKGTIIPLDKGKFSLVEDSQIFHLSRNYHDKIVSPKFSELLE